MLRSSAAAGAAAKSNTYVKKFQNTDVSHDFFADTDVISETHDVLVDTDVMFEMPDFQDKKSGKNAENQAKPEFLKFDEAKKNAENRAKIEKAGQKIPDFAQKYENQTSRSMSAFFEGQRQPMRRQRQAGFELLFSDRETSYVASMISSLEQKKSPTTTSNSVIEVQSYF